MNKFREANKKIENVAVSGYKVVENGVETKQFQSNSNMQVDGEE